MFLVTTVPAATKTLSPITQFSIILEPNPIQQFFPILTFPAIVTPGHI